MKKFKFFTLLIFLTTSLFAITDVVTFQFIDFINGNSNFLDTEIKVKYKI